MIECRTIAFDDSEKVELARCCSRYTGSGNRVLTATMHVAAKKGFTKFVELALERGFAKLLRYSNDRVQLDKQNVKAG